MMSFITCALEPVLLEQKYEAQYNGSSMQTLTGEITKAHKILIGKHEGKRHLGEPWLRWDNSIKMDLK
jgi:hypothetical protein